MTNVMKLTFLVETALAALSTLTFSVTFANIFCDNVILAVAVFSVSSRTFLHNPNGVLKNDNPPVTYICLQTGAKYLQYTSDIKIN